MMLKDKWRNVKRVENLPFVPVTKYNALPANTPSTGSRWFDGVTTYNALPANTPIAGSSLVERAAAYNTLSAATSSSVPFPGRTYPGSLSAALASQVSPAISHHAFSAMPEANPRSAVWSAVPDAAPIPEASSFNYAAPFPNRAPQAIVPSALPVPTPPRAPTPGGLSMFSPVRNHAAASLPSSVLSAIKPPPIPKAELPFDVRFVLLLDVYIKSASLLHISKFAHKKTVQRLKYSVKSVQPRVR